MLFHRYVNVVSGHIHYYIYDCDSKKTHKHFDLSHETLFALHVNVNVNDTCTVNNTDILTEN